VESLSGEFGLHVGHAEVIIGTGRVRFEIFCVSLGPQTLRKCHMHGCFDFLRENSREEECVFGSGWWCRLLRLSQRQTLWKEREGERERSKNGKLN
jgi:hypothetical protein